MPQRSNLQLTISGRIFVSIFRMRSSSFMMNLGDWGTAPTSEKSQDFMRREILIFADVRTSALLAARISPQLPHHFIQRHFICCFSFIKAAFIRIFDSHVLQIMRPWQRERKRLVRNLKQRVRFSINEFPKHCFGNLVLIVQVKFSCISKSINELSF